MNLSDLDLEPVTEPERNRSATKMGTRDSFFDGPTKEATAKVAAAAVAQGAPAPVPGRAPGRHDTTAARTAPIPASPVVQKMRAIFGIVEDNIVRVPVYVAESSDPVFTFGLRTLVMDDFEWIAEQIMADAAANGETVEALPTPKQARLWDYYITACAVATLDEGPVLPDVKLTPVWQALGLPIQTTAHVRNPYMPHASVRHACAEILFEEFRSNKHSFPQLLLETYKTEVEAKQRISSAPQKTAATPEPTENPTTPEP